MISILGGEYLSFSSAILASSSSCLILSLSASSASRSSVSLALVKISVTSLIQSKSSALHIVNAYSWSANACSSAVSAPVLSVVVA